MAGCYGDSAEDRYFESRLMDYLDGEDIPSCCEECDLSENCKCNPDSCSTGKLIKEEPDWADKLFPED